MDSKAEYTSPQIFKVSVEDVSIHPVLSKNLQLGRFQRNYSQYAVMSHVKTIIFPVVEKKGMKKNRHYYVTGSISEFLMIENKNIANIHVCTYAEKPSEQDMLISNLLQMVPSERNSESGIVFAAQFKSILTNSDLVDIVKNYFESTVVSSQPPLEIISGIKQQGIHKIMSSAVFSDAEENLISRSGVFKNKKNVE